MLHLQPAFLCAHPVLASMCSKHRKDRHIVNGCNWLLRRSGCSSGWYGGNMLSCFRTRLRSIFSSTKLCRYCGNLQPKSSMFLDPFDGFFCNEDEFEEYKEDLGLGKALLYYGGDALQHLGALDLLSCGTGRSCPHTTDCQTGEFVITKDRQFTRVRLARSVAVTHRRSRKRDRASWRSRSPSSRRSHHAAIAGTREPDPFLAHSLFMREGDHQRIGSWKGNHGGLDQGYQCY